MDWFRSHHGAPTDPKWLMIARRANVTLGHASVTPGHVASVWWALMDYASQHESRGSVTGFDAEELAAFYGYEEEQIDAILAALREKDLITADDRLANWEKRQPAREDTTAAERKRRQRERERLKRDADAGADVSRTVTQGHAPDTDTDTELKINNPDGLFVASEADDAHTTCSGDGGEAAKPKPRAVPNCPHSDIIDLYHELLPANPRIRDWTPARAAHLRARWNEDPRRQNLDWWRKFFTRIAEACPFLTGQKTGSNGRPFTPGLEWLVKAENFTKILEGRYVEEAA